MIIKNRLIHDAEGMFYPVPQKLAKS